MDIMDEIKKHIENNKIIIFMKGSPEQNLCEYTNIIIKLIEKENIKYNYINIIENYDIKKKISLYNGIYKFPQIYINKKLINDYYIFLELYKK